MPALLLYAPGLVRRHLEGAWLTALRSKPPTHRADLVTSFPASPAVIEATLRSGLSPAGHGVHHAGIGLDPTLDRTASLGVSLDRFEEVAQALATSGPGSEGAALQRLDAWLVPHLSSGEVVFLVGGPSYVAVRTLLDPNDAVRAAGGRILAAEGAILWVEAPDPAEMRESLLHVKGVERVLMDDGLTSWGCHRGQGILALAGSGSSFVNGAAVCGRRDHAPEDTPILLGWYEGKRWPTSVHDTRIAATLAALAGADRREGDEPL